MSTGTETLKHFFTVLKEYSTDTSDYAGKMAINKAVRAVTFEDNLATAIQHFKMGITGEDSKYANLDTATRLQELTGMVLGEKGDYSADTGAISGSNAGGSVVKNAADIVPESGDLSTATLPEPSSTSQITYTGNDGKSFTFNVKWQIVLRNMFQGRRLMIIKM